MSKKYYHRFEVRWSDIDANRHLANSSYVAYCAQARMAFMKTHKMGLRELNRWGIGAVALHEEFSFFKEILPDQKVYVSVEITGMSEDASMYQMKHQFYLEDGTHCATAQATGVWIDTMLRKITTPPDDITLVMEDYKTDDMKVLKKEDLKKLPFQPQDIDPQNFNN